MITPFGTKGVGAQRRGDAILQERSKSHPPQSPFLRKGEANDLRLQP